MSLRIIPLITCMFAYSCVGNYVSEPELDLPPTEEPSPPPSEERDQGRVGAIGISALCPEDAMEALDDPDVRVIQVASSLLDRRLQTTRFFEKASERGVAVHVRSVFLQGAAFLDPTALPRHLEPLAPSIRILDDLAEELRVARPVLFMAWAQRLGASRLLVGCERIDQLQEQIQWFQDADEIGGEVELAASNLPSLGPELLDPSRWS